MGIPPIKNAKDITTPWANVFLYGPSGGGKTTCAASFPSPLFLVPKTENSVLTLRGKDFKYIEIATTDEMVDAIEGFWALQQTEGSRALPFETLVLESLSHYCDMIVGEIFQKRATKKGSTATPRPTLKEITEGAMQTSDWGVMRTHFVYLQRALKRLDAHIVMTALADPPSNDQLKGRKPGEPLMQGAARDILPSACDVISFVESDGGVYRAHQRPHANYTARSRFEAFPSTVNLTPQKPYYAWLEAALEAKPA